MNSFHIKESHSGHILVTLLTRYPMNHLIACGGGTVPKILKGFTKPSMSCEKRTLSQCLRGEHHYIPCLLPVYCCCGLDWRVYIETGRLTSFSPFPHQSRRRWSRSSKNLPSWPYLPRHHTTVPIIDEMPIDGHCVELTIDPLKSRSQISGAPRSRTRSRRTPWTAAAAYHITRTSSPEPSTRSSQCGVGCSWPRIVPGWYTIRTCVAHCLTPNCTCHPYGGRGVSSTIPAWSIPGNKTNMR
ncbi:hypothetical protein BS47DRAFT_478357 [Hydnum rufescens UP504]|uniref:Uncharacterized protein n=1 Tax=Hydnum rufescens UP504 TaxID=1448309 RepID=A0A9P6AHP6_9AGAM|nr:hypothetical protein BS47DRAFT_478357 [Hydnum rufescens UP504]